MQEPKQYTILVVDDDDTIRKTIVFDFKRRGFNTLEAENGTKAFEIVTNQKVDLVLSDVRMPGGNGIEFLGKVKAIDPDLPIVMFITGFADLKLEDAYDLGADAVFAKPFDRKKLMEAVTKSLTSREKRWNSRKHDRIDTDFTVDVQFPDFNMAIKGRVLNIGRGGIFVALTDQFPKIEARAVFSIKFQSGSLNGINGTGTVRWIRMQSTEEFPSGCGIEFDELSDTTRDQLVALINDIKTRAFIPKT